VATLGMVLRVPGVDYESLDHSEQEYAVKRLEAAFKHFGPGFHVYQFSCWMAGRYFFSPNIQISASEQRNRKFYLQFGLSQ
jgi:hypothetical protein